MPPQAEANLAFEYSTDTRKLEWERPQSCQPRDAWLLATWAAPTGPKGAPREEPACPRGFPSSLQCSPEHDRGHGIDSEEEPDNEHVAVHEHLAVLEDGGQSCH